MKEAAQWYPPYSRYISNNGYLLYGNYFVQQQTSAFGQVLSNTQSLV
jgi:hypothetical protein